MKSAQRIQLAVGKCVWLHFVLKTTFCQIISTTRCRKLCLTSCCVKNYVLPNFRDVLLKNAFCMKSAQRIQLAVGKCVWLHFVLKTTFCQIISTTRCRKLCLTSCCVKNYVLPNFKDVLLKNAFLMKSAQRIQLAVQNCVLLQFELKLSFFHLWRISC